MGGLDAVVFTAGIGENTPEIRALGTAGLEFLGIEIDADVNNNIPRPINTTCISTASSKVKVYVIPTNEELMIANDAARIASGK